MKSFPETVRELWVLVRSYARQELVEPLSGLAHYLGWGIGGALSVVFGAGLMLLGVLRLLQSETVRGRASDGTSALPYLAVFVLCGVTMFLLFRRINRQFEQRP